MEDWEIVAGDLDCDIYQDYIISECGYEFLAEYTDELVFYNERLGNSSLWNCLESCVN